MIAIQGLRVEKLGSPICVVDDLLVEQGEHLLVLGANGSGKSTLLRVLAGLETAFTGKCDVGVSLQHRVFVHQSPWLFQGTVMSNAVYGLLSRGQDRATAERLARRWLELFDIADLSGADVRRLSGGEQRRVALARAFVLSPKLLLLDEPLSDLDRSGEQALFDAIQESNGSTTVITSPQLSSSFERLQFAHQLELS